MLNLIKKIYHQTPFTWRVPKNYYSFVDLDRNISDYKQIKEWQLKQIRQLVEYAYNNIPGYHQLYSEQNINLKDIRHIDDISILPFTSKEIIRENLNDFVSKSIPESDLEYVSTSGSSGIPFGFFKRKEENWIENAFVSKAWEQIGWNIKQSGIILRGGYIGDVKHIYKKCDNNDFYAHNNSYLLSPYYILEDNYDLYKDFFLNHQFRDYMFAYPSSASLLAGLIDNHGDNGAFDINALYLGSENLYPWQIDIISKAFPKAKIMSCYGQTERVIFASWCNGSHAYHINPFYGYTEILGTDNEEVQEGQIGELVGTAFWALATPFIRYKTNDYAAKGDNICNTCGKPYQLLNRIDGRLNEAVVSKYGRPVSMTSINMHDSTFDNVAKFRFFQKEPGVLTLFILPNLKFNVNEDPIFIKNSIMRKLGDDFILNIQVVNEIRPSKSGKYSFLEQHIKISQADRLSY